MKPWIWWTVGGVVLAFVVFANRTRIEDEIMRFTIDQVAKAIATAEGYYVPGSKPNVNNNPGSLFSNGGKTFNRYATPEEGWNALRALIRRAWSGPSIYSPAVSWRQFAWMYVNGTVPDEAIIHASDAASGGPDQWLRNVQSVLGFSDPDKAWRSYVVL